MYFQYVFMQDCAFHFIWTKLMDAKYQMYEEIDGECIQIRFYQSDQKATRQIWNGNFSISINWIFTYCPLSFARLILSFSIILFELYYANEQTAKIQSEMKNWSELVECSSIVVQFADCVLYMYVISEWIIKMKYAFLCR